MLVYCFDSDGRCVGKQITGGATLIDAKDVLDIDQKRWTVRWAADYSKLMVDWREQPPKLFQPVIVEENR